MRSITGNILTLDLATNTGWACGAPGDDAPRFGHHTLPSTGDNVGRFALAFSDWLSCALETHAPQIVVFEAPILPKKTNLTTTRKLQGLAFETERLCYERGIPCREGRKSSVSKLFAGNGRAQKEDTVAQCRRYGWRVTTDDEADACALWAYTVVKVSPEHAQRFALGPLGATAA